MTDNSTTTVPPDILSALQHVAENRIASARLRNGSLTLVIDVGGIDDDRRAAIERSLRAAIVGITEISTLHIAQTAEKGAASSGGMSAGANATPSASSDAVTGPRIIAVGSGKGGVGKSTLATNIAVALARQGRRVGMVDADIYGPSLPRLLASENVRPQAQEKKLIPVPNAYGIPMLSMGHLVKPGQAIAWRGPMAGNALGQLVDADWTGIDILVVDLPPGTGDVQLTMIQRHRPAGAVIVSTPQDLALIDATRAISLFEQAHVPIIGMVENMAGYVCPHCGEVSDPFGQGGAEAAAADMNLPFLGRVPLDIGLRMASDAGVPPALGNEPAAAPFHAIAERIGRWLDEAVSA